MLNERFTEDMFAQRYINPLLENGSFQDIAGLYEISQPLSSDIDPIDPPFILYEPDLEHDLFFLAIIFGDIDNEGLLHIFPLDCTPRMQIYEKAHYIIPLSDAFLYLLDYFNLKYGNTKRDWNGLLEVGNNGRFIPDPESCSTAISNLRQRLLDQNKEFQNNFGDKFIFSHELQEFLEDVNGFIHDYVLMQTYEGWLTLKLEYAIKDGEVEAEEVLRYLIDKEISQRLLSQVDRPWWHPLRIIGNIRTKPHHHRTT